MRVGEWSRCRSPRPKKGCDRGHLARDWGAEGPPEGCRVTSWGSGGLGRRRQESWGARGRGGERAPRGAPRRAACSAPGPARRYRLVHPAPTTPSGDGTHRLGRPTPAHRKWPINSCGLGDWTRMWRLGRCWLGVDRSQKVPAGEATGRLLRPQAGLRVGTAQEARRA